MTPTAAPRALGVGRTPGRSGIREALVSADAIRRNVATLRADAGTAEVLADVSSDAFGHGALRVAAAALAAGVQGLIVARPGEAAPLRAAGIHAPVISWSACGPADLAAAARDDVTVGVASVPELEQARDASVRSVQLIPELGGHLPGAAHWQALCEAAARSGVPVTGVLGGIDRFDPDAARRLDACLHGLERSGVDAGLVHVCDYEPGRGLDGYRQNTARLGAALYGLSDTPGGTPGTEPVLTLTAPVVAVKPVPAGEGVSYGYTYITPQDTLLLLVPLGYADGIPRRSGNIARVGVHGVELPVAGRVAMDALMLDAHPLLERGIRPAVGDVATVIGAAGWSAAQWAQALGTTSLDIVSRLGARIARLDA